MKITIEKYNPGWEKKFEDEKELIRKILFDLDPIIEHIGSTSVKGLGAKPIIDIMVGINSEFDLDEPVNRMIKAEYFYIQIYESIFPERRFFIKPIQKTGSAKIINNELLLPEIESMSRSYHVHLVYQKSHFWRRHILFRNILRTNPVIKENYFKLKMELSALEWKNSNEYAKAKSAFIESVLKKFGSK